jgi:hypothetical protein
MSTINIITVCYNTSEYIELLRNSVEDTIGSDFTFTVMDNGSDLLHEDRLKNIKEKNNINILRRKQAPVHAPSRHHGEAINDTIKTFKDTDIIAHVDCDSVFIMRKWGPLILEFLNHYAHVSCRRPVSHLDTGPWFTAFKASFIRKHQINFMPKLNEKGEDLKRKDKYDVGSI